MARQPSRKGGCPLAGEGVNAISSAPISKKRKKVAVQSDLRNLVISSLPKMVGRTSPAAFKHELIALLERTDRLLLSAGPFVLVAVRRLPNA
jgi:hypothetical protein